MALNRAYLITSLLLFQSCQTAIGQTGPPAEPQRELPSRVVRDPVTGRLFQQQIQSVQVPVVRWESKPQTQTVYEPEVSTRYVAVPQLTYVPVSSQVLYPVTRGLWNPFRTPVQAYEYRTVTQYQPRVQNYSVPVSTQKWVPKKQTIYVPQPVQRTETRQQVVTTEIPGNRPVSHSTIPPANANLYAAQPSPRLRIPILARQSYLHSDPTSLSTQSAFPTYLTAPVTAGYPGGSPLQNRRLAFASVPGTSEPARLRPVAEPSAISGLNPPRSNPPYRTASRGSFSRDTSQSGMSATVLR
ncbi:MAG: hypothetical protein ACE361_10590 [Aureliella sp.]